MKRPTTASLKKVNADNLAGLGAERLAQILIAVADTRPDVKRRLGMELAADCAAARAGTPAPNRALVASRTSFMTESWRPADRRPRAMLKGCDAQAKALKRAKGRRRGRRPLGRRSDQQ